MGKISSCLNSAKVEPSKTTKESSSSSNSSSNSDKPKNDQNSENEGSASESQEAQPKKMLLLGAGGVGKSTVFKIITNEFVSMYTDESDLREFKDSIHENVIETMKTVIKKCCEFKEYTDDEGNVYDCNIDELLKDEMEQLLSWENEELNSVAVDAIMKLNKDPGFKTCLTKLRHLYTIPDGAPYFLDKIDRIWSYDYVPSFQDILYCRDRTTGVTHEEIPITIDDKKIMIDLYDVGGQRAERRAWKLVFNNVSVIIFVFAVSEFNQKCIEDQFTNRMVESLGVLKVLNNAKVFKHTPILLLMTKVDQLAKKLESGTRFHLPLKKDFPSVEVSPYPEYEGDNSLEDVKNYLLEVCKLQMDPEKKVVSAFKNLMDENVSFEKELRDILRC